MGGFKEGVGGRDQATLELRIKGKICEENADGICLIKERIESGKRQT